MRRQRDVAGVVAGVEVSDDDLFQLVAHGLARLGEAAKIVVGIPGDARTCGPAAAAVLRVEGAEFRRPGGHAEGAARGPLAPRPALLEVGLDHLHRPRPGHGTWTAGKELVRIIPGAPTPTHPKPSRRSRRR